MFKVVPLLKEDPRPHKLASLCKRMIIVPLNHNPSERVRLSSHASICAAEVAQGAKRYVVPQPGARKQSCFSQLE